VSVELADDHPGVTDPAYRRRRNQLASLALEWRPGLPLPEPEYLPEEHEVWRAVSEALGPLHERNAASVYLEGKDSVGLPSARVPQLSEVSALLGPVAGFEYLPVAGLAPLRDFYGSFASGAFWSTQYLRHPSVPLYTPEPDIIHEVIGHANQLGHPMIARLYRMFGEAVERTRSDSALQWLSRVFWFTMEFGVVRERGTLKALGAGILSSVGETASFAEAETRRADLAAMGSAEYDITKYQPVLYEWDSIEHLDEVLSRLLEDFDDDTYRRIAGAGPELATFPR
jgi:phenylalanine-4-hydroxylase